MSGDHVTSCEATLVTSCEATLVTSCEATLVTSCEATLETLEKTLMDRMSCLEANLRLQVRNELQVSMESMESKLRDEFNLGQLGLASQFEASLGQLGLASQVDNIGHSIADQKDKLESVSLALSEERSRREQTVDNLHRLLSDVLQKDADRTMQQTSATIVDKQAQERKEKMHSEQILSLQQSVEKLEAQGLKAKAHAEQIACIEKAVRQGQDSQQQANAALKDQLDVEAKARIAMGRKFDEALSEEKVQRRQHTEDMKKAVNDAITHFNSAMKDLFNHVKELVSTEKNARAQDCRRILQRLESGVLKEKAGAQRVDIVCNAGDAKHAGDENQGAKSQMAKATPVVSTRAMDGDTKANTSSDLSKSVLGSSRAAQKSEVSMTSPRPHTAATPIRNAPGSRTNKNSGLVRITSGNPQPEARGMQSPVLDHITGTVRSHSPDVRSVVICQSPRSPRVTLSPSPSANLSTLTVVPPPTLFAQVQSPKLMPAYPLRARSTSPEPKQHSLKR